MTTPQPAALPERIWTCQIGGHGELPQGADGPMRDAIASAFKAVTGSNATYCFSGWGHSLPERYRAVVEDRLPDPEVIRRECFAVLDTLPDAVTAPGGDFAALQSQPAAAVSDEEIERIFKKCGGKWNGDHWVIEDADLHPAIREFLALRPQAVPMTDEQILKAMSDAGWPEYLVNHVSGAREFTAALARRRDEARGITAQGAQGEQG